MHSLFKAKEQHFHGIKWTAPDKSTYSVTCDREGTITDVLMRTRAFQEIANKNEKKELVILKKGNAISDHFPCRMINEEHLSIKYVKNNKKVGNIRESEADFLLIGNKPAKVIVFHLCSSGGENIRMILRNTEIKKVSRELTVYAYEGETVENALQRDGRFLDNVFENNCRLIEAGTEEINEFSTLVSTIMNDKTFHISKLKKENQQKSPPNGKPGSNSGAAAANEKDQNPSLLSPTTEPEYDSAPNDKPKLDGSMPGMKSVHEIPESEGIVRVLIQEFDDAIKAMKISLKGPNSSSLIQEHLRVEYGKNVEACKEVRVLKQLMELSDSVCLVVIKGRPAGTGFLLFDQFVLTNCHVVKDVKTEPLQDNVTVYFTYEEFNPKSVNGVMVEEVVAYQYLTDESGYNSDWALLKLVGPADISCSCLLKHFGYLPESGGLCIIGHPDCGVKKIDPCFIIPSQKYTKAVEKHVAKNPEGVWRSDEEGHMQLVGRKFFEDVKNEMTKKEPIVSYNTCFYFGSSGSPVFDDNCKVVALHSGGYVYYKNDKNNKRKSVIEYGYLLSFIIRDMIIKLVDEKKFDVLSKYLSVDYIGKQNIRDGVKKLKEHRGLNGFDDALESSEVRSNKDLKDFFDFICQEGTVGMQIDRKLKLC